MSVPDIASGTRITIGYVSTGHRVPEPYSRVAHTPLLRLPGVSSSGQPPRHTPPPSLPLPLPLALLAAQYPISVPTPHSMHVPPYAMSVPDIA
eukprot:2840533-Rhodomonas_salina.1